MHRPALKMLGKDKIEKHVLRSAFDGVIPHDVLWRQKEQFSDGVGYGGIDALFPHRDAIASVPGGPSIACSSPTAIAWDAAFAASADPSGRAIGVHRSTYD